jgi:hypothetical protein
MPVVMARNGLHAHSPKVVGLGDAGGIDTLDATDALAAFHSEADWPEEGPVTAPRSAQPAGALSRAGAVSLPARTETTSRAWVAILFAAVALAEAPFVAMWIQSRAAVPGTTAAVEAVAYGTVYVETEPSGVEVWVNGGAAGRTPARLSIPRGAAEIQLRHADHVRTVPLTIVPEEVVRLRVELPVSAEESVELSDSVSNTPDIVVVVSAQAEDIALLADTSVDLSPSAERDSTALALVQQSPAQ